VIFGRLPVTEPLRRGHRRKWAAIRAGYSRWVPSLPKGTLRGSVLLFLLAGGLALAAYSSDTHPAAAPPAATPPLPRTPAPDPAAAWLGLNYNSDSASGSLRDFARRGIVYDREGRLEVRAGRTADNGTTLASGLAISYAAHMIPVNPGAGHRGCEGDPVPTKLCLPTSQRDVQLFVRGFVQTAHSVLSKYPQHRVLFEPTDEPWDWPFPPGTPSGKLAAKQYASILALLLPAVRAAKIPLSDVYVPATGVLEDGSSWIPDLYEAKPCLKPGPRSCGPIAGWNLHPYGLPHWAMEGIDSVPHVRAQMASGRNNILVSEIGFCAIDVNNGSRCDENKPDIVGTSKETAIWLRETLDEAARMHRAGWLRALLIWERSGPTGWVIQNANGTLTAQGRVLDLFASSRAGR
jgi:hypothetical protein